MTRHSAESIKAKLGMMHGEHILCVHGVAVSELPPFDEVPAGIGLRLVAHGQEDVLSTYDFVLSEADSSALVDGLTSALLRQTLTSLLDSGDTAGLMKVMFSMIQNDLPDVPEPRDPEGPADEETGFRREYLNRFTPSIAEAFPVSQAFPARFHEIEE